MSMKTNNSYKVENTGDKSTELEVVCRSGENFVRVTKPIIIIVIVNAQSLVKFGNIRYCQLFF